MEGTYVEGSECTGMKGDRERIEGWRTTTWDGDMKGGGNEGLVEMPPKLAVRGL